MPTSALGTENRFKDTRFGVSGGQTVSAEERGQPRSERRDNLQDRRPSLTVLERCLLWISQGTFRSPFTGCVLEMRCHAVLAFSVSIDSATTFPAGALKYAIASFSFESFADGG